MVNKSPIFHGNNVFPKKEQISKYQKCMLLPQVNIYCEWMNLGIQKCWSSLEVFTVYMTRTSLTSSSETRVPTTAEKEGKILHTEI